MRLPCLFIAAVLIGFSSNGQTGSASGIEPYDYDTTLKGGYTILFKVSDSLQHLYLKKGGRTISELSSTSKGMLYKTLGYVGADFTNYFVLVHSFGSGNPHYIELIEKVTGKNVLKNNTAWITADEKNEYLLYNENDNPGKKDKMTLHNVRTGQKQRFEFPEDIFSETEMFLNSIEISQVTVNQLVLKYQTEHGAKMKVYSR